MRPGERLAPPPPPQGELPQALDPVPPRRLQRVKPAPPGCSGALQPAFYAPRNAASDASALTSGCRARFCQPSCDWRWRELYVRQWGQPGAQAVRAAQLAGSWHALSAAKRRTHASSAPWAVPCEHELGAAVEAVAGAAGAAAEGEDRRQSVVFLLDGSGSVTEDDFACMKDFARRVVRGAPGAGGRVLRATVVQFSNDARTELGMQLWSPAGFDEEMDRMSRMNGGTNFILALHEASKVLKQDLRRRREEGFEGPAEHTVVMLTDGRIDAFQSREARRQIEYMADELPGLRLFCYVSAQMRCGRAGVGGARTDRRTTRPWAGALTATSSCR